MILYDSKALIETISILSYYLFSVGLSNNPGILVIGDGRSQKLFEPAQ